MKIIIVLSLLISPLIISALGDQDIESTYEPSKMQWDEEIPIWLSNEMLDLLNDQTCLVSNGSRPIQKTSSGISKVFIMKLEGLIFILIICTYLFIYTKNRYYQKTEDNIKTNV